MKSNENILKEFMVLSQLFGKELSKEAVKIYLEDLKDHPEPIVLAALLRCRRELKFFPAISEILERINYHPRKLTTSVEELRLDNGPKSELV